MINSNYKFPKFLKLKGVKLMKKTLTAIFLSILLLLSLFFPIANASAEKISSYKWGKTTYKANHVGKIVVTKNTSLYYWDKEYDQLVYFSTLKKGEERPVYAI